jgi:hypothetical protein
MAKTSNRAAAKREKTAAERVALDKQRDWDRQDVVARRVEDAAREAVETARLLAERQDAAELRAHEVAKQAEQAAALLVASNERVSVEAARSSAYVSGQLQQIHTLVNSNMTAAMQAELDARQAQLITLRELLALKTDVDHMPSREVLNTVALLETKIAELEANLADRLKQTRVADSQAMTTVVRERAGD